MTAMYYGTYIHMHVCMYVFMYVFVKVYSCICICMYAWMCTYILWYIYIYIYIYIYTYLCIHISTFTVPVTVTGYHSIHLQACRRHPNHTRCSWLTYKNLRLAPGKHSKKASPRSPKRQEGRLWRMDGRPVRKVFWGVCPIGYSVTGINIAELEATVGDDVIRDQFMESDSEEGDEDAQADRSLRSPWNLFYHKYCSLSLSLSLSIYIYIYIYIHTHTYICIYIDKTWRAGDTKQHTFLL
jgi:hypothetical protein